MNATRPPQVSPQATSRRTFLSAAAGSAALASLPVSTAAQSPKPAAPFRFAFLPCIHFRFDLGSPEGLGKALEAVGGLDPAPDFLLTGGDICHNLRDESLESSARRADAFTALWGSKTNKPTYHCFGNHDLAAWNDKGAAGDPHYGKKLLLRKLGMASPYHSFDHQGWHFVVLDYLKENGPGDFSPEISAAQLAWLKDDIARHRDRPTVVVTHAPLIAAFEALSDRGLQREEGRMAPFGRVVSNLPQVMEAIDGGSVRAFLSGHLHTVEEIRYRGMRFVNSGSVSGHQWNGPRLGFPEGFGVFDCRADGTFDFDYRSYGWTASGR
jgi:3',5'-cyclic AMP phosphodiesterase CpdA